jgi:hypothetical protein
LPAFSFLALRSLFNKSTSGCVQLMRHVVRHTSLKIYLMHKTNLKKEYLDKVAFVNDQLCYFQFADEIVRKKIEKKDIEDASRLTTDIFSSNKFSKRIQVRFSELESFRNKAKETTAGISLSFGVEHLPSYLDALQNLKMEISNQTASEMQFDSPEERLQNNLKKWNVDDIESAMFKTIKYLRLRRNHIVHTREDLTDGLNSIVKQESNHLTNFWSTKTSLAGLDFSDKDVDQFSVEESYTCMKLIRVCIEEIDEAISASLTNDDLVNYMTPKVLNENPELHILKSKLSRKVSSWIKLEFGRKIKPAIIEDLISKS